MFFSQISQLFSQIIFLGKKKNSLFFSTVNHSCPDDQFKCQNNRCIPKRWLCDGANDCGNNEDESNKTCAGKNFTWLCKQGSLTSVHEWFRTDLNRTELNQAATCNMIIDVLN